MVYVILRNGKRLHYNEAHTIKAENGTVALRPENEKYLVARIPLDIVERVEFNPPCRITRESTAWKRKR